MEDNYKICFIISHKYYRNYTSYIQYYVDNIQKFYKDSLCIIVDNNSKYISDIINKFKNYKNVIILYNVSLCKFELGAYKFGIYYLIQQNILDNYDYIVFSQDNYVLKNKYDFNVMKHNNILAISFGGYEGPRFHCGLFNSNHSQEILSKINLLNDIDKLSITWCNSFILNKSKCLELLDITKNIITTNRDESQSSERYLSAIMYYFNNNNNYFMNNICELSYDCWKIDLFNDNVIEYFAKRVQQKTEKTIDN